MKRLYSIETKHEIIRGAVVEYLPYRTDTHFCWVKIKDLDAVRGQVHVANADGSINAWTDAASIGARFGRVPRSHGQTKKQAQHEANKAAAQAVTFQPGPDLQGFFDLLAAKGLTPTGRRPSQPEMQHLPARDMHGARSGVGNVPVAFLIHDEVERFTVSGKLETVTHLPGTHVLLVTGPEFDAILAGLALLREAIAGGMQFNYDSVASRCWTNDGEHAGLDVEAVQALANRLNHGE